MTMPGMAWGMKANWSSTLRPQNLDRTIISDTKNDTITVRVEVRTTMITVFCITRAIEGARNTVS